MTRVAVIGAGWWGHQHARVFSSLPWSEVCAVVSRTPERAHRRAREFGGRGYTDIGEMLEAERPDLVSICLPNTAHFAPTLDVVRAGVPLLVEKPLVFDLAEADQLLAEAAERDLFFAINFNHRYARAIEMAREAITSGRIGTPVFATWRFGGEGSSEHHPHANLIESQCHGFDQLEDLCGPIRSVAAAMTDVATPGAGFGTHVLALGFDSGAVGSLVGTYDSSYAYRGAHLLEVNGTEGRVIVEDTVACFRYQARGNATEEVWRPSYFDDPARTFTHTFDRHAAALILALQAGDPPPIHARAGRRALGLAYAAIESHATGRRVEAAPEATSSDASLNSERDRVRDRPSQGDGQS